MLWCCMTLLLPENCCARSSVLDAQAATQQVNSTLAGCIEFAIATISISVEFGALEASAVAGL
jgi:hypothetical protein